MIDDDGMLPSWKIDEVVKRHNDQWIGDKSINVVRDLEWRDYEDFNNVLRWMGELGWIFINGFWVREEYYNDGSFSFYDQVEYDND